MCNEQKCVLGLRLFIAIKCVCLSGLMSWFCVVSVCVLYVCVNVISGGESEVLFCQARLRDCVCVRV